MKTIDVSFLILFLLSVTLPFTGVHAQNSGSYSDKLNRADELFSEGRESESLDLYLEVLDEDPENLEALWNTVVIYAKKGFRLEGQSEEEARSYYEKARELAERALEHHPDSGYSHYAMAVAKARLSRLVDTGDKIEIANEIKEHIDEASGNLENFAPVWHLYGVWHSDVANTSGAEKTIANIFTEGLPDASNEKAEEYIKRAISLDKSNILFRLDLARHYLKSDQPEKARNTLKDLREMEPKLKGDEELLNEAEQLLSEMEL